MRPVPHWPALGALAALCALASLAAPAVAAGAAYNLVVNKQNPVASLSTSDLKRVISGGTKVWDGGAVVQIGLTPGDAQGMLFLATAVDTSPRELLSFIQQQVFKGEVRRPIALRAPSDCLAFASATPGGICIAPSGVPVPDGARVVPLR
jgi:hypothetical protein